MHEDIHVIPYMIVQGSDNVKSLATLGTLGGIETPREGQIGAVLGPVGTVIALPQAVLRPAHLALDGRHEFVWSNM